MNQSTVLQIKNILEAGHSLTFTSESSGQGGEKVIVQLNDKPIGEVYTWDKEERRHRNVVHGSDVEAKLAGEIKEWMYDAFFPYVAARDIICDSYRCDFQIDEDVLTLGISGEWSYDGMEETEGGMMVIEGED